MNALLASFAAIRPGEWIAVALALGYLLLAVRQNPWCWGFAIASSAIYLALFVQGGLLMQAALQVFYIGMGAYGWWAWRGGGSASSRDLPVTRWSAKRHWTAIFAVLTLGLANGWLLARGRADCVPYVDALVAWSSVLATWMVARKVLENWLYWIVIDTVAAGLYWSQGFHATTVLFGVYVVIAIRGYFAWRIEPRQAGGDDL